MKIEGSNSAAHDEDYDNTDGRAGCSTNSDIMAFYWEQNTQMVKYQVKIRKYIN